MVADALHALQLGSPFQVTRTRSAPSGRAVTSGHEAVHDAELVRRFKAGDEVAFVEIVTRFRGRMHSIALSHLRNHADAVEITQKLGISIGTVKSRLGRACEKLRILLAEPYTELAPDASPPAWFEPVQACGRALVVAARAHATRRPRSNDF